MKKKAKKKSTDKKLKPLTFAALQAATERLVKTGGWNTPKDYLADLAKELGVL